MYSAKMAFDDKDHRTTQLNNPPCLQSNNLQVQVGIIVVFIVKCCVKIENCASNGCRTRTTAVRGKR